MHIGRMTATWLILVTVFGCGVVPIILIYETTIRPYYELHHVVAKMSIVLINLIPNVSLQAFHSTHLI